MPTDMKEVMDNVRFEDEVRLVKELITHRSGMNIELLAAMSIRRHSDGFEVSWAKIVDGKEVEERDYQDFECEDEAARFFCNKRREFELGEDFESAYAWEIYNECKNKSNKETP